MKSSCIEEMLQGHHQLLKQTLRIGVLGSDGSALVVPLPLMPSLLIGLLSPLSDLSHYPSVSNQAVNNLDHLVPPTSKSIINFFIKQNLNFKLNHLKFLNQYLCTQKYLQLFLLTAIITDYLCQQYLLLFIIIVFMIFKNYIC